MEEPCQVFLEMPSFLVDVTEKTRATEKKQNRPNSLILSCEMCCLYPLMPTFVFWTKMSSIKFRPKSLLSVYF